MKTTMFFTVIFCISMGFALSMQSTDAQRFCGAILGIITFGINSAKLLVRQAKELDQK